MGYPLDRPLGFNLFEIPENQRYSIKVINHQNNIYRSFKTQRVKIFHLGYSTDSFKFKQKISQIKFDESLDTGGDTKVENTTTEDSTTKTEESTTINLEISKEDSSTLNEGINTTSSEKDTAQEESTTAQKESTTLQGESSTVQDKSTILQEESTTAFKDISTAHDESTTAKKEKDYVKPYGSTHKEDTTKIVTSLNEKEQNILPLLTNDELKNIGGGGKYVKDNLEYDFEPTPYQMINDENEEGNIDPTPYQMINLRHRKRIKRQ